MHFERRNFLYKFCSRNTQNILIRVAEQTLAKKMRKSELKTRMHFFNVVVVLVLSVKDSLRWVVVVIKL
jgi:hypothetical protein